MWEWTPLLFLIILAGLQSLPQDPLEAARVDGAGPVRLSSTTPCRCCGRCCWSPSCCGTIDAVGTFDQIYVLTKGGPGTSTQLISIYAYNTAFLFTQYGQAAAMLIGRARVPDHPDDRRGASDAARGQGDGRMKRHGPRVGLVYWRWLRRSCIALFPFWWMLDHVAQAAGRHLRRRGALPAAAHLLDNY